MKTTNTRGRAGLAVACIALVLALACISTGGEDRDVETTFTSDPVMTLGHGSFLAPSGETIVPDADFILSVQAYYIQTVRERLERDPESRITTKDIDGMQAVAYELVDDPALAGALLLDWLLENDSGDTAHMVMVNNALRWYYVLELQDDADSVLPTDDDVWTKGIPLDIARALETAGFKVFYKIRSGGGAYQEDCLKAGVPVPRTVMSDDWENRGVFVDEFISTVDEAELWLWRSDDPAGVCLALPRYDVVGTTVTNDITLLGVICLGTASSRACFFDNPNYVTFQRGDTPSIDQFVGGANLVANGQGICSDCHAGENPYIVHPEKPPFAGLTPDLLPAAWHKPLVVNSWPHNPGPTNLLSTVSSSRSCLECHVRSNAGRFPEVSRELSGYCGIVRTATGGLPKRTMPPYGQDPAPFAPHADALKAACDIPVTPPGEVVPVDDVEDPTYVSPPTVYDPIYACATAVAVRGAVLDAEVQLYVNGSQVDSFSPARNPSQIDFFGLTAFVKDDVVEARQIVDGVTSGFSPKVIVKDHTEDYPTGLPDPWLDPTLVYECASVIAVRHVPGARVTIWVNGGNEVTRTGGGTGWTIFRPGKTPFDVGDIFSVQIGLCDDKSGVAPGVFAVARPGFLPLPTLDPPQTFAGQELVNIDGLTNGSQTTVGEVSFGQVGAFSTPVSWKSDYDVAAGLGRPLTSADRLTIRQELCDLDVTTTPTRGNPCEGLPAPRIRQPLVGEDFVIVTQSIPGARIRVFDANGNELGDGAGVIILLNRTLAAGDVLTVVQSLEDCEGRTGYRIPVFDPKRD